jgi:hypothetical protein
MSGDGHPSNPRRGTSPPSADPAPETPGGPRRTNSGAGRALIAVYGLFALAATARAAVQIATQFAEAPLAYLLSAAAAAVYILATITLARGTPRSRRVALVAVTIELVGVLSVGTLSVADSEAFPRATVWSVYGIGYGFVPLVLPILGLIWLYRTRPVREKSGDGRAGDGRAGDDRAGDDRGGAA